MLPLQRNEMDYAGWRITEINEVIVAIRRMPNGRVVAVPLQPSEDPEIWLKGWWPYMPSYIEYRKNLIEYRKNLMKDWKNLIKYWKNLIKYGIRLTVITGICLWDARWQVKFKRPKRKKGSDSELAPRSPALPTDRNKMFEYLQKGHEIAEIWVPVKLGEYHLRMLSWVAKEVDRLQPDEVLCHVPQDEYEWYIDEMGPWLNDKVLRSLHQELHGFAGQIRQMIQDIFPRRLKVKFVRPLKEAGASSPLESYRALYEHPEWWGAKRGTTIGIEALEELTINLTAWDALLGQGIPEDPIPVLCGVLGPKHPYMVKVKEPLEGVKVIEL